MNTHLLRLIAVLAVMSVVACGRKETPPPKPVEKAESAKPKPEMPPEPPKPAEPDAPEVKPSEPAPVTETPVTPKPDESVKPVVANEVEEVLPVERKPLPNGIPPSLGYARRIVFLGDHGTQPGEFITDFECFLLANGVGAEILNLGLSGELASEPERTADDPPVVVPPPTGRSLALDRITTVLERVKPDVVFLCYGTDDSGVLPVGGDGLARFATGYAKVREAVLAAGVKHVVCVAPGAYEFGVGQPNTEVSRRENVYMFTSWLGERASDGWVVVDVAATLDAASENGRRFNTNFSVTSDGVTLNRIGGWIVAQNMVRTVTDLSIDGVPSVDALLGKKAAEIRKLVAERSALRRGLWMPGADSPATDEANSRIAEISAKLAGLLN